MSRTKTLTTKSINQYKWTITLVAGAFILAYGITGALSGNFFFSIPVFGIYAYWFLLKFPKYLKKIKGIEYDESNLYVTHNDYEVQVPFENIKDVEIVSLDGLYKFTFHHEEQVGKEVYCKPSMWYPFNFKKIDAELNRIRSMITRRKQEVLNYKGDTPELPGYSL